MLEDEEILSNANRAILEDKSVMEDENSDKEVVKNVGQCEYFPQLDDSNLTGCDVKDDVIDDSNLTGCDVKDEVVVTEDKPAEEEGGKDHGGVDGDVAAETGLEVELSVGHETVFNVVDCGLSGQEAVEGIPVVQGELEVAEGTLEMALSDAGDLELSEKGGEELMPTADEKVEASSDGEMAISDRMLTPIVEKKVETVEESEASEGGAMAVSDVSNLEHGNKDCEMVIVGEELQTSRGGEMAVSDVADSTLGKGREETSLGGEMAVSHAGDLELGNNGREDMVTIADAEVEPGPVGHESEASDAKTVTEIDVEVGTKEKVSTEEVEEVLTEGAIDCKEKVAVGLNDSEIGVADELTAEDISTSKDKVDSEMKNDARSAAVGAIAGNQVHGLDGAVGIDETESLEAAKDEYAEDKTVVAKDGLLAESLVAQEKDVNMDVSKDSETDKPMNAAEIIEEAVAEEDIPAADTEMETETEGENGNLAERISSKDTRLTIESEVEIEKTNDDVSEFGQEEGDSMDALQDEEDENMAAQDEAGTQDTEMETENIVSGSAKVTGAKQKKGKKSKTPKGRKLVGDDVCFICFDGGDLVMCDCRGCPKAYHPSCVNRDEAFFKAKGIWNCGWHLCSICEKNAYYKCYTCPYSLCRGCIKDAVILCVRGNKGFCETCMRFVLLIENNDQGNKDDEIDFDDKSSWEYLFKDYYIELKSKVSLSSDEVANAKNPWKGTASAIKQESPEAQVDGNDGEGSGSDATEKFETPKPKRRKLKKHSKTPSKKDKMVSSGATAGNESNSVSGNAKWASEELLEFVSHMKNGDTSALSQFAVQALLLEYIKRNNLRDPRRKSQIRCDARFENLFGKSRVGHFEMLKLLESHFLVNEDSPMDDVQGSVVDTESDLLEADGNDDTVTKGPNDKKRKKRKKGDNRAPQSNVAEYAAIDMHNINLIYLRRKLIEDLLEDIQTFHDKVVGMFVRIRISGISQKQDMYRLVQVLGTSKATEPYKIGKRTSNIMLEILNLNKTEIIPIDIVSNQEFTEEECKRLRQSIKCGLISRLTVGDILEKAMEIQAARVNDWLESEILRLGHLCDRASDLGRRKELRECVEKLQLLKTPGERRRRLEEIPKIHADPKMDPGYESDDDGSGTDESPRDAYMGSRGSGFSRRERGLISPGSNHSTVGSWAGAGENSSNSSEASRNLSGKNTSTDLTEIVHKVNENLWNQGRERDTRDREPNNLEMRSSTTNSESIAQNVTVSTVPLLTSPTPVSAGVVETSTAMKINETEKMWLYQDPSGNVQGPFSLVQLRRWSNTGYFPADLRTWKTTEMQEDSILLTDVLAGKCLKELPEVGNKQHNPNISSDQFALKRLNAEQKPVQNPNLSDRKSSGNDPRNLRSSTPKQSKWDQIGDGADLLVETQRAAFSAVVKSPAVALPQLRTDSSASSSVPSSSPASKPEQVGLISGDFLQTSTLAVTSEPQAVQMNLQDMTIQPVQSVINRDPQVDIRGSDSASSQKVEPDASIPQSGQSQIHGWCGSTMSTVQNLAGDSSNSGTSVVPQFDFWQPPTSGVQSNMMANAPWTMQANPTTGWGDQTPGSMNMSWAPVQVQPTGNTASGPTTVQGPVSGNVLPGWYANPSWGPPNGNTGTAVQLQGPVLGWGPPAGIGAPPIQGSSLPGNGAPLQGPPPTGTSTPQGMPMGVGGPPLQGPAQGNSSQGWGAPAGVQGMWSGAQNPGGAPYRGGFSGGRPWNGQPSFGRGAPRPFNKRNKPCPYNTNGRCRKGAYCDYLHT